MILKTWGGYHPNDTILWKEEGQCSNPSEGGSRYLTSPIGGEVNG